MKTLLTLFGLLITGIIFSQEYYPIVQENNEWNELIVIESGPYPWDTTYFTETYKLTGDTIINNLTYKKMYKSGEEFPLNWSYWGGIREENQQVWHQGINNYPERLIYDFTINIGDTISIHSDPMVVDTIYYMEINGSERKYIHFSYCGSSTFTEYWIEGIGSNKGILNSGSSLFVGGGYWLLCMKEDGEIIYMNPNYNNCFLITEIREINNSLIQIYPNPAQDIIKIKNTENINIESISIVDFKGQKLLEFEKDKTELNLSGISAGIYLLKLTHKNGEMTKKIVIK